MTLTARSKRLSVCAGLRLPALPASLRQLARRIRDNLLWRTRFLSLAARRALGIAQPRRFSAAHLAEGLTLVLPGIESESIFTYGICDSLSDGGIPGAIQVFNWGLPFPGGYLANLVRIDRNRRRASDLARRILQYQNRYPGCPVNVVAHSGGAGVGVFALEALPKGCTIESLVLLSGALSPRYDLSRALSRVRRGILNSYSCRDTFVLNWGTRLFGTTDRQFVPACGCVGFTPPPHADPALYRKLTQICWSDDIGARCSHSGGHITSAAEDFLQRYITPWMKRPLP